MFSIRSLGFFKSTQKHKNDPGEAAGLGRPGDNKMAGVGGGGENSSPEQDG